MAKKILIAEDEKPMAKALALKLNNSGFEAKAVHNGKDAVEELKAAKYDLLLLDLMMPTMDGFQVLEQIKAEKIKTSVIVTSNLSQLTQDIIDELKSRSETKQQKLSVQIDKTLNKINLDPNFIRMIIENLLTNAIKYTPEKGSIKLTLAKTADEITLSVGDTGYGIPVNQQKKIFSKLFRADNVREKDTDGNGLGLYIVKAILDQSGGKIWFDSSEGKGTTFHVTLPLTGMNKKEGSKMLSKSN
jgi:signal transduction histidine kinase